MNKEVTVQERGWVGHFCLGEYCRYRRNTLISKGKKRIVVSTVGALKRDTDKEVTKIGFEHYYETMVFKAKKDGAYYEIDVTNELYVVGETRLNFWNDSSDNDADLMHDNIVNEVIKDII